MKKFNIIAIALVGIIFFSACKSGMDITKRRYNKGYYVHKSHTLDSKKSIEEVAVVNEKTTNNVLPQITAALTKADDAELKPVSQKEFSFSEKQIKSSSKESSDEGQFVQSIKSEKQQQQKSVTKHQKKSSGGDANLILLVILSLFPILSLIAVYLHDGKSITTNFWITLLLHFIALYWLYALLVVLDVIDFA